MITPKSVIFGGVALALATATATAPSLSAGPEPWRHRAQEALEQATPYVGDDPFVNAYLARARATLYGWQDREAQQYLRRVLYAQGADGGWGTPYDGFARSHAITTAQHVGPTLLDAYRHGQVPTERLNRAVNFLLRLPRTAVGAGSYVAPNPETDRKVWIHNINAGVALFLHDFGKVSAYRSETVAHVTTRLIRAEVQSYMPGPRTWVYREDIPDVWQDADHNALSVEALLKLKPTLGKHAAHFLNRKPYRGWGKETAPLAYVHLNHPDGPAQFDKFMTQIPSMKERFPGVRFIRYAQLAYFAALNSR